MRKVFLVLLGLILSGFMISCSDDSTTPIPVDRQFEIVTASLPVGWTCAPYRVELEATGGKTPYIWALADGSNPLPEGMSMTAEGEIVGLLEAAGEWTITVQCTDATTDTPKMDTQELTIRIDIPANPSLGVYFDGDAVKCCANTEAFDMLDCFVYIILDAQTVDCCMATEFKIDLVDADGNSLEAGTEYAIVNVDYPDNVSLPWGDPFTGLSVGFGTEQYEMFGPIPVVYFELMLIEDLNELSFIFEPRPGAAHTKPIIATCDQGYPIVEVTARQAAVNYNIIQ